MKLLGAYLEITHFCNRRCNYCYNVSDQQGEPMPFPVIKRILDQLISYQAKSVTISGGEPFSHPYIMDILRYCQEKAFDACIITNCDYLSDQRLTLLAEHPLDLQVTLDGYDEQTHDAVKGAGNYRQVCLTLQKLRDTRYQGVVTCRINITKQNSGYLDKIAECAAALGVNKVSFAYINSVGRAYGYVHGYDYRLDIPLLENLRMELLAIKQMYAQQMSVSYDDLISSTDCPFNKSAEPTLYPRIAADGTVYPCQLFEAKEFSIGNIFDETLTDICSGEKLANFVEKIHRRYQGLKKCDRCVWKRFCERGCPAKTLNTRGEFFGESATCELQKRYYLSKANSL